MSWGGFGNFSAGGSAYANRGGPFTSGYSRGSVGYRGGGGVAGGRGYGGAGFGGAGFGFSYGGGLNSSASAAAGYRATGGTSAADASGRGSGTPRVAVIGTPQSAFVNWWALHAAGFQVSVVVGVEDAHYPAVTTTTTTPTTNATGTGAAAAEASEAERKASAEAARAFAVRCTHFYRLPRRAATGAGDSASATARPSSSSLASAAPKPAEVTPTAAGGAGAARSGAVADLSDVMSIRVRVANEVAPEGTALTGGSTTAAASTPSATNATPPPGSGETKSGTPAEPCVTATAWSFFFQPFLEAHRVGGSGGAQDDKNSSKPASGAGTVGGSSMSHWSNRSSTLEKTLADAGAGTAANVPLIDDVEVIYIASLHSGHKDATACAEEEAGVRAALMWLIGKGKHLVVDCVLSSATLAACAAAAATVTRGKPEMHRVLCYRGGGLRCGWSAAAMTQLRTALAVRRGTGQACKVKPKESEGEAAAASAAAGEGSAKTSAGSTATDNATTTATTTAAAAAKPKTPEADNAFSVFDFMGSSDANPFGETAKDAEESKTTAAAAAAATAAATESTKDEKAAEKEAKIAAETPVDAAASAQAAQPQIATSLALTPESGRAGALQQIRFTVRGNSCSSSSGEGDQQTSALGVMGDVGWDAVAWLLHLLDWTCPDMVQGRVVRRAAATQAPACVEAELYYGIDGTAEELEEDGGDTSAGPLRVARPQYLRVLLHISSADADSRVFQQCVRVVGSKAVVTVTHPLLPMPSQASLPSSPPPVPATPPPSSTSASSPFKVTTTRTMGVAATSGPTSTAPADAAAAATPLPATPAVSYSYTVATQDAPPGSYQRMRKEETVTVTTPTAASTPPGEPCAEARVWQHVREQLHVSATTTPSATAAGALSSSSVGMGGYQPYGSRYATRGRYGANVGLGSGGSYYGRGRGGVGPAAAAAAAATPPQTVVKAELTKAEAAALDVQRAWLVQMVVEQILASAATV